MDKDLALKILKLAEDLNDSPHSFIINILNRIDFSIKENDPDRVVIIDRLNVVATKFAEVFKSLYNRS